MAIKARPVKPSKPTPESPMEWPRADPAALDQFDPATKTCTMNCGPHGLDPRSRKERLFLCDDCDCHAAPHEPKGTPAMSKPAQSHVVTLTVDNAGRQADTQLSDEETLALAQLVKRLTWGDLRGCAVDDAETYTMRDAVGKLQDALARAGYAPR